MAIYFQRLFRCIPLFIFLYAECVVVMFLGEQPPITDWRLFIFDTLPQPFLPLLAITILAAYNTWLFWGVFSIATFFFTAELVSWGLQGTRIWTETLLLILQTNSQEASEFLSASGMIWGIIRAFLISIVIVAGFIWTNRQWKKLLPIQVRRKGILAISAVLILLSATSYHALGIAKKYFGNPFLRNGHEIVTTTWASDWFRVSPLVMYYYIYQDIFRDSRIANLKSLVENIDSAQVYTELTEPLTVVFVIGESHIKHRSSLYSYPFLTEPNLVKYQKRGNLIALQDVVTNSGLTHEVIKELLSTHNVNASKDYSDYPLLPALFKKVGYDVGFLDNQSTINKTSGMDWASLYFFSNSQVYSKSISYSNDKTMRFDLDFVETHPPHLGSGYNFVIYHLMGQHRNAKERFPKGFGKFIAEDYSKADPDYSHCQFMADYDNASLYNDSVLARIVDYIKDQNAVLVYTSDHGEEIYDCREQIWRKSFDGSNETLKMIYQVPAFIYVSDIFKERYPGKVDKLRQNAYRPIFNSDLPHTLLDLAGITTQTFDSQYSLLRDSVLLPHRIIEGIDYDAIKDEIDSVPLCYHLLTKQLDK